MDTSSYKQKAVRGVFWTALARGIALVLRLGVQVLLAHLLVPEDFGLAGMVLTYTGLLYVIGELGFSTALIQRRDLSDEDLSTALWSSLGLGVLLYVLSMLFAPLAAAFYTEPRLADLLRVVALSFVVTPIGVAHSARLNRALNFRALALASFASTFGSGLVSLVLAVQGFGAWSIAWGSIAGSLTNVIFLWALERWVPVCRFSWASFRSLISFGGYVTVFNLLNFAGANVDYAVIGRVLGPEDLGIYVFAYTLATMPHGQLSSVIERVAFPTFSRVQQDDEILRRGYLQVAKLMSLVLVPLLAGSAVLAPNLFALAFGHKWDAAVLPFQVLCVAGIAFGITSPAGAVFYAKGRPQLMVMLSVITLIGRAIASLVGTAGGSVGVALGIALVSLLFIPLVLVMIAPLIDLRLPDFWNSGLRPSMLAVCPMIVTMVLLTRISSLVPLDLWQISLAGSMAGGGVYLASLRVSSPDDWKHVLFLGSLAVRLKTRRRGA